MPCLVSFKAFLCLEASRRPHGQFVFSREKLMCLCDPVLLLSSFSSFCGIKVVNATSVDEWDAEPNSKPTSVKVEWHDIESRVIFWSINIYFECTYRLLYSVVSFTSWLYGKRDACIISDLCLWRMSFQAMILYIHCSVCCQSMLHTCIVSSPGKQIVFAVWPASLVN